MTQCAIDGCGKSTFAKGMCGGHYKRASKYGNSLAGSTAKGAAAAWLFEHVRHKGDECLIWPFARVDGYARVNIKDRSSVAHRVMCEEANGPPPSPDHEAAHSCGNGSGGCVNPRHLSWKTHIENEADKIDHGTLVRGEQHYLAKITAADAIEIFNLQGTATQVSVAAQFGICRQAVSDIWRGRNWGWLTSQSNPIVLNKENVHGKESAESGRNEADRRGCEIGHRWRQ